MLGRIFRLLISFILGTGITLFLFYIDEGNYTLDGLWQLQNIPAFVLYGLMFSGAFYGIAHLLYLAKQKRALDPDA